MQGLDEIIAYRNAYRNKKQELEKAIKGMEFPGYAALKQTCDELLVKVNEDAKNGMNPEKRDKAIDVMDSILLYIKLARDILEKRKVVDSDDFNEAKQKFLEAEKAYLKPLEQNAVPTPAAPTPAAATPAAATPAAPTPAAPIPAAPIPAVPTPAAPKSEPKAAPASEYGVLNLLARCFKNVTEAFDRLISSMQFSKQKGVGLEDSPHATPKNKFTP